MSDLTLMPARKKRAATIGSVQVAVKTVTGKALRARKKRQQRRQTASGCVLYRGPSPWALDGLPEADRAIVILLTFSSTNRKTGDTCQLWLFADKLKPTEAKAAGLNQLVCGDCALMQVCYVKLHQAPRMIWNSYKNGNYPDYQPDQHDWIIAEKGVRFGAYGDPVLVPIELVQHFVRVSNHNYTGFTEQWAKPEYQMYRPYFMASVHRDEDIPRATALGWRHYRVGTDGPKAGEVLCPHQNEKLTQVIQCSTCQACNGASRPVGQQQRHSIFAYPTGTKYINTRWKKNLARTQLEN
jgi:hypothetical protein